MQEGDVLAGKYRVDAPIGAGAMGVVWRATQLELDRPVAVKLLHPNIASSKDARARFAREARTAATLHHPNAVRVLDFGEGASGPFLVMELLVGSTLRARLDAGPVPRADALRIAAQIARVLEAAHRVNLVHRDIKPENTFLTGEGAALRVRVVDFGLAFIADATGSLGRLTDEGVLGGTPAYMSPEQARAKAIGPPSDVYSLGCTLYELLAGRPPFVGNVAEMITRHAYAPPLMLSDLELVPPVDAALDDLVLAMLGKSPPLRPTAGEVAEALEGFLAAAAGPEAPGPLRLQARATRLAAPPSAPSLDDDEVPPIAIRVEGTIDDELRLELAAGGVRVVGAGDPARAVFAPGAALDELRRLAAGPLPVVTDVDGGDFDGLAARVRAGCRDAVPRPARADVLARKLRRLVPGAA